MRITPSYQPMNLSTPSNELSGKTIFKPLELSMSTSSWVGAWTSSLRYQARAKSAICSLVNIAIRFNLIHRPGYAGGPSMTRAYGSRHQSLPAVPPQTVVQHIDELLAEFLSALQ